MGKPGYADTCNNNCVFLEELRAQIKVLEAENARLREKLKPRMSTRPFPPIAPEEAEGG